jgi:hypothetical protein
VCVQVLVEKPETKRQLGRHTSRWEDSIKMDLKVIRRSLDRSDLAWNGKKWPTIAKRVIKIPFP